MTDAIRDASWGVSSAGARFLSLAATAAIHVLAFAGILAATGIAPVGGGKRTQHLTVVSLPQPSPPRPAKEPERQGKAMVAAEARVAPPAMAVGDTSPKTAPTLPSDAASPQPLPELRHVAAASAARLTSNGLEDYKLRIWQQIHAHRPRGVRASGTTLISLRVSPDGSLLSAEIARSSGNMNLDRIALRAVRQAAPFPAAPATLGAEQLVFAVPMDFR